MLKQNSVISLPTDHAIVELKAATNLFCKERNLRTEISTHQAAMLVNAHIRDLVHCNSRYLIDKDSAETLLKEFLPWYEHNPQLAADYFPNVFDTIVHSTELLVRELITSLPYDLWDVRTTQYLTTTIRYSGDYRIVEWERSQGIDNNQQTRDIYVRGEDTPRLYANLIYMGHYRSIRDGHYITNINSIDGDVVDIYGNVVLNTEDISKGLI